MNEDTRAVNELVADVRGSLETSVQEVESLQNGLSPADDVEGEGLEPVRDSAQIERLARLKFVLQTALVDLP